ncbi:DNA polymerase [Bosea sp. BE125]|uniref:UdgX family uracil-DNA binding protein n=1 Tax=Bosea sp. BE125 TaxID=2817909 RepID=UPI002860543E|nr:UdgX family uracil-DNA binding protein [Bosea sp. BE125]MDR6872917.1 DNA polymerase [Bosea sp. BE125]
MFVARLAEPADFEGWRRQARVLAQWEIPAGDIVWHVGDEPLDLFDGQAVDDLAHDQHVRFTVPREFPDLAEQVVCHRDPERFGLLYRLLLRLRQEPDLLKVVTDPDVHRLNAMARTVRRDLHKMTAFVRFREVRDAVGGTMFVAWFEPEHFIVRRVSAFFVNRFSSMRWAILTPLASLHWDGTTLQVAEGAARPDAPHEDAMEEYWRTYYANIFNPARLKIKAMKAEMPEKYWRNLPEAALIAPLIAGASQRMSAMVKAEPTHPSVRHARWQSRQEAPAYGTASAPSDWHQAATAARSCARCDLCRDATQTVFGSGPLDAPVMFVGEQPGDQEDLAGKPFVGPAGQAFDKAMAQVGFDRRRAYVTNAVKHFKFTVRGKRRIHESPNAGEIKACRFWLGLEREFVRPRLIVAMGATALMSILGKATTISSVRDLTTTLEDGTPMIATVHPSYLLRLPDEAQREKETARFVADLNRAKAMLPALLDPIR